MGDWVEQLSPFPNYFDPFTVKIEIPNSQPDTLLEAQTGTVKQFCHPELRQIPHDREK